MALAEEHLHGVLANYTQLQTQFSDFTVAVEDGESAKTDILRQLTAIKTSIEGVGKHLSSIVPTRIYNERRSANSTIAHKVLCIPELFELILEHTSVLDVIKVSETCRELKAIIQASPRLQTKLFLRPAGVPAGTETKLKLPPMNCVKWFSLRTGFSKGLSVVARFQVRGGLPRVGGLWKRMQLCHPPLKSVELSIKCWACGKRESGRWIHDFSTGAELTFGDLYDEAANIFVVNESCVKCNAPRTAGSDVIFVAKDPWKVDGEQA